MSYISSWIQLATTPYGSALDATKIFWPAAPPRKSHFRAAAKMRAVKLENEQNRNLGLDCLNNTPFPEKNGEASSNFTKIIVGADSEKSVTRTRVVTATALGILASKLPEAALRCVIDPLWQDLTSLSGVQRQVGNSISYRFIMNIFVILFLIIVKPNKQKLQVASMIVVAWFREFNRGNSSGMHASTMLGFVNDLRQWLLDLLACTDPSLPTKDSPLPYSELSRTYMKMHNEANLLYRAVDSSCTFKRMLSNTNFNPDSASVDDAISFASKISLPVDPSTGEEIGEHSILDDIESSKQRLLSTSGYLKCVQVCC